jgi:hypothetical protein
VLIDNFLSDHAKAPMGPFKPDSDYGKAMTALCESIRHLGLDLDDQKIRALVSSRRSSLKQAASQPPAATTTRRRPVLRADASVTRWPAFVPASPHEVVTRLESVLLQEPLLVPAKTRVSDAYVWLVFVALSPLDTLRQSLLRLISHLLNLAELSYVRVIDGAGKKDGGNQVLNAWLLELTDLIRGAAPPSATSITAAVTAASATAAIACANAPATTTTTTTAAATTTTTTARARAQQRHLDPGRCTSPMSELLANYQITEELHAQLKASSHRSLPTTLGDGHGGVFRVPY